MLILMIVISLIGMVTSIIFDCYDDAENLIALCGLCFIVSAIAIICCTTKLVSYRVIDDRIKLYQKQNKEIEQKIELVVKEYKDFEKDTFTGLKSDSYITLVNLYPELKSDKMVQQQIDLYTKNNKKITSLKEEKINKTIYRWWVYFGK